MNESIFRQELLRQARRLVFSSGADAAELAFRGAGDAIAQDARGVRDMDLSAVSSIHRMANGSVELKFIDRIKLIELLLAAEGGVKSAAGEGDGFIAALDRAAMRLGGAQAGTAGADPYAAGELDLEREAPLSGGAAGRGEAGTQDAFEALGGGGPAGCEFTGGHAAEAAKSGDGAGCFGAASWCVAVDRADGAAGAAEKAGGDAPGAGGGGGARAGDGGK